MRKVIVNVDGKLDVEAFVLTDMEQFIDYRVKFPTFAPLVKENLRTALSEGKTIIVWKSGGYCYEAKGIKIVRYLDEAKS